VRDGGTDSTSHLFKEAIHHHGFTKCIWTICPCVGGMVGELTEKNAKFDLDKVSARLRTTRIGGSRARKDSEMQEYEPYVYDTRNLPSSTIWIRLCKSIWRRIQRVWSWSKRVKNTSLICTCKHGKKTDDAFIAIWSVFGWLFQTSDSLVFRL
jgi:hypothetical protein